MSAPFRVGMGYDVHRLAKGRKCMLGGIEIPSPLGPDGHSDADVLLHAVTDAILGAFGGGDIGMHFPPSDPKWKGAPSAHFVQHAAALARDAGWQIGNVDCTVIAEEPRLRPHVEKICENMATLLGIEPGQVSLKATTQEKLGALGRGEGIAAYAVALLWRP